MHRQALDRLADELTRARPRLNRQQQRIAIALYRLLAEGQPVPPERLAERARADRSEVLRLLDDHPGVYRDETGCVIGFWGLALSRMPHRMRVNGNEVRAWCAWDTLFLPELLGKTGTVHSRCPATGEAITLTVDAGGVRDVSPDGAVLSFLHRDAPFDADTIATFCHHIHFFASDAAAREWTATREGIFVLSIDDGFEIARRTNRAAFGDALEPASEALEREPRGSR